MNQKYVAGSNVPGFFWGTDYYPDSRNPDDADLSSVSGLINVQFRLGPKGSVQTVAATKATRTIDGVSHDGLLISAADMAATLTTASNAWEWRFNVDLAGDSKPCFSKWKRFEVG
jgi:hypothetical protein